MSNLKITIEGDSGIGKGRLVKELKQNLERGAWDVEETINDDESITLNAKMESVPTHHPDHQKAKKFLVDYIFAHKYLSLIGIIEFRLKNDVNNDTERLPEFMKIVFPEHIGCNHYKLAELLGIKLPSHDIRMDLHDNFWKSDIYKVLHDFKGTESTKESEQNDS